MKVPRLRLMLLALLLAAQISQRASLAQEPETPKTRKTTVYYLKHAQADEVEKVIKELYADVQEASQITVVAEPRMNALLISGSDKFAKEIEDLLKVLDAAHAEKPKGIVKPIEEVKVFTLKNIEAQGTAEVVKVLMPGELQISADGRTNTLIATGPKEKLEVLEALLIKLDETQKNDATTLRVYPLEHTSSEKAATTLSALGLEALYSVDAANRRILVRGDEAAHKAVEEFIQTIDVAKDDSTLRPMQLRIVWLVEEKLAGKDAREPAKNLEKVLQVLNDKLGVTNLKMAAQLLVTVDSTKDDPNQTFTAHGTTSLQEGVPTRLEANGQIIGQMDGRPTIQLSIEASQPDANGDQGFRGQSRSSRTLTSLTTKVAAPAGHSIVLGLTPIQSADSVFVLQVLSTEETSAPTKSSTKRLNHETHE